MRPEKEYMGIVNTILEALGFRNPDDRYKADRMRIISKKYRDSRDPLFRGSPKDYQEILQRLEAAALEGEFQVTRPVHLSDEITENLENLGYDVSTWPVLSKEGAPGAQKGVYRDDDEWYVLGTKISFS